MVDVAQLVESRIVIPVVVGSSPIVHPNIFKHLALNRLGAFSFMGHRRDNWGNRNSLFKKNMSTKLMLFFYKPR
jgi:hypothetical protein